MSFTMLAQPGALGAPGHGIMRAYGEAKKMSDRLDGYNNIQERIQPKPEAEDMHPERSPPCEIA